MADASPSSASADSVEALQARITHLEAQNQALRAPTPADARRRLPSGRAVLASVLIVLGLVSGTVGLVAAYAKLQLLDTSNFVESFAPLASDPAVQGVVSDAVVSAIDDAVDVPALTSDVISGIRDLGLPPRADAALGMLEAPAAMGLQNLIDSGVRTVVSSEGFATTWEQALRLSHSQTMAALHGDSDAVVTISDGALQLQIGPLVAEVKDRLVDRGIRLAEVVPSTDRSIVLVEDDSFEQIRTVANLVDVAGTWLPWVSLALLFGGVATARRRRRTTITAAVATAVLMGVVGLGLSIAGSILARTADRSPGVMTGGAMQSFFGAATGRMSQMALAIGTLGVAVAVIAWMAGSSRLAAGLRSAMTDAARAARVRAEHHGITTGRIGAWIDAHHRSLLIVVGVIAAAVVLLSRPLSPAVIVWTAVLALVAVLILQLVRRPADIAPESPLSEGTRHA